MSKRRFRLYFEMFGEICDVAVIELDAAVIDVVDDEWQSTYYELRTPEEIAAHIGFSLVINRRLLSSLDGWADQPAENARVLHWPGWEELEITAKEIKK